MQINDGNDMSTDVHQNTTHPSLPPLHFKEQSAFSPNLCSELETTILSYLTWGDHARLAPVHSCLATIVHDAAEQSNHAKWSLAQSLLRGENGLDANPALALGYLQELAGVSVSLDDFDPQYKAMEVQQTRKQSDDEICYAKAAMRQLATCYLTGTGIEANPNMGLSWLQQAYHHGDLDAAYETATIHEHGKYNVPVDIYIAAKWCHGAAKAGHVESMAEYAMCLELGCGVDQSDNEALDWYTQAAEQGHVSANFSVGEMFECARGGLPQSDTEAVLWYYKAASLGDEDSKRALKRLKDIARIVVPGWAAILNV